MEEQNASKGLSAASLILGILSMLCCCIGFPFAIIGIILAIVSLVKHKGGKGLAVAGLITSGITMIISVITAISLVPVMPYIDGWMDFGQNAQSYMEEYEEYGTYPPVIDDMIDDGLITEEEAEQTMDQMMQSMASAIESAE